MYSERNPINSDSILWIIKKYKMMESELSADIIPTYLDE
jgi:hypothetical protein